MSEYKLLYRATEQGFTTAKFHELCDNKGKTLVIIKSSNDRIFGGYTDQNWHTSGNYSRGNKNSFVWYFNTNQELIKLKCNKAEYEIYNSSNYGPCWGSASAITIENNFDTSNSSYSSCTSSSDYDRLPDGSQSVAGDYNFKVKEMEVFNL